MGIDKVGKPAVFLDRDGVLNATVFNTATNRMESPLSPKDFRLLDGVIPALRQLQSAGFPLILVSNQPNFALGKSTMQTLSAIHYRLVLELMAGGVTFATFYYCLHHPRGTRPRYSGACVCRKPSPWFLLRARDEFGYSLKDSWIVGDQATDIECGKAAGVSTVHVGSVPGSCSAGNTGLVADLRADYRARDLAEAAEIILGQTQC